MSKFLLIPFCLAYFCANAQFLDSAALANEIEYTSVKDALANKDKAYKLNLSRTKLDKFPKEIFELPNLQELDISKNKIIEIPAEIGKLENLQILNLSKNKIVNVPDELGDLVNLKTLILNQNEIEILPPSFGKLTNLVFLDLWGNYINEFPKEMGKLENNLKYLDLRVITMKQPNQDAIQELLPNTNSLFSKSCNCY
jgi:Leucine-rich repeat (LRR) protein